MRRRQEFLPGLGLKPQPSFGGSKLKSHPKEQRAISLDKPIHVVMRSRFAIGRMSFRQRHLSERIYDIILRQCERFKVTLYEYGNGGNHIHILIQPKSRKGYCGFIRSISGLIARLTLKAERNHKMGLKFWDARPFTRIVSWGRDYKQICQYLVQNTLEAFGFIEYQPRGKGAGFNREWKVRTRTNTS